MEILVKRLLKFCGIGSLTLAASMAFGQVKGDQLMPPVVNMTQQGWSASLQMGDLSFGLPLATVPGEVPLTVAFGLQASYTSTIVRTMMHLEGTYRTVPVYSEVNRPMVGGIHFGYIADPATYGDATTQGLTVLETGAQILDSQWTAFSSNSSLGTVLNLPQAYQFGSVPLSQAMVDPSGTYLTYMAPLSAFGPFQSVIQGLIPSVAAFGTGNSSYKVVMDKDKARVFAYAGSLHAWIPIFWVDRFQHHVSFKWDRATSGLPSGVTAITKVTALNQRSKGVILRWADYSDSSQVHPLLRLDYEGVYRPSVLIQGYSGYTTAAPSAYVSTTVPNNTWVVVPSIIGSTFRPTNIQVGPYGQLSQPSWSGCGPSAALAPGAPGADGTQDSPVRTWTFSYDGNRAEVESAAQPNGVNIGFSYTNYPSQTPVGFAYLAQPRGVSQILETDSAAREQEMRWTRTFPTSTTPMTIKVEGWWDPLQASAPGRYHLYTFPTDSLNYGNGVYQTDQLMETANNTQWSKATYAWTPSGAGLTGELSSVDSVAVQSNGSPTLNTVFGYAGARLQTTEQDLNAANEPVTASINKYVARWDMLDGHELAENDFTRYVVENPLHFMWVVGTVVQKNVYDNPTSGYPLLQLQKSYLDGGSTGQHGTLLTYDTDGRPYDQQIYHMEGTAPAPSPNVAWVIYDPTTGSVASQWVQDNRVGNLLSRTFKNFNSAGQPTIATDPNGVSTTYTYDDRGRVLSASKLGAPLTTYAYPDESTVQATVNGCMTTTSYDGFGRVVNIEKPTGFNASKSVLYTKQTLTYDVDGRETELQELSPKGSVRKEFWFYDPLNRLTSQTSFVGGFTSFTYGVDATNPTLSAKTATLINSDGTTIATTTKTNPLGQVVESDTPDGTKTTITYDQFGNQSGVTITPSSGTPQSRSWQFDGLDRLVSKIEPETNTQSFANFNALNEPTLFVQASGSTSAQGRTLVYDGLGRLTGENSNAGDSLILSYTGTNLYSATRVSGVKTVSTIYKYQGPGGLLSSVSTTQPSLTTTIGYTFDSMGRLQSLAYPDGRQIGYGYDDLGRVINITNNGLSLVNNINYDEWGNRWQTQFASGAQDEWDAQPNGVQLKTWSIGYVGGGPQVSSYQYDNATNVLKTAGEWALKHDTMGRLIEADGFGIQTAHNYDAFGNDIYHKTTPSPNAVPSSFNNFTFNPMPNNQIPGQTASGATTGWNTNLLGEATQVGAATASATVLGLGWDGLGLVKSVVWSGGNETYLYDGNGYRVNLTDSANATRNRTYAYTPDGLLLSENASATSYVRDVVYLGLEAVAEIDGNGVHELHNDHLGTPRLITYGAGSWSSTLVGTIEGTQAYGPYGECLSKSGYQPLTGYTGHIQTDPSGLIYMRGRYYSPAWHAFVNSDQGVDPSTWNQRAYVGGSPFMGMDPSGMMQKGCVGGWVYESLDGWWVPVYGQDGSPIPCGGGGGDDSLNTWLLNELLGTNGNQGGTGSQGGGGGSPGQPQSPKPNPCAGSSNLTGGVGIEWEAGFGKTDTHGFVGGSLSATASGFSPYDVHYPNGLSGQVTTSVPAQATVYGAAFSTGKNITFGNAAGAGDFSGVTHNTSVTLGVFQVTYGRSDSGVKQFSFGFAAGLSFSKYDTVTASKAIVGTQNCH